MAQHYAFEAMGTVVSLTLVDELGLETQRAAVTAVEDVFARLNERFSLYRDDSEISHIAAGKLALADSSDEMRTAYADALVWRERTNGIFTPHRPDGVIDLSGTIKAVAIAEAADALRAHSYENFSVNAGGDVAVTGDEDLVARAGWTTGIVDPSDRSSMLTAVVLDAELPHIATSGNAERGEHIWRRPESELTFVQASVLAPDMVMADVLATTVIAGGIAAFEHASQNYPVAVFAIDTNNEFYANPLFEEHLAQ